MALAMTFFSAGVSSRPAELLGTGTLSSPSISRDEEGGGDDEVGDELAHAPSARPTANATINPRLIFRSGGRDSYLSLLCIMRLDVPDREQSAASIPADDGRTRHLRSGPGG